MARGLPRFTVVVWLALGSRRFDTPVVAAFAAVHKCQQPAPVVRRTPVWHLWMVDNEKSDAVPAKVRFSASFLDAEFTASNPVDAALSWVTSDVGSLVMGLVGLVLLLASRLVSGSSSSSSELYDNVEFSSTLATTTAMGEETRANLLAVFAIGTVLLNGLSRLDVQSVLAEAVVLQGTLVTEPVLLFDNANAVADDSTLLSWTLASIAAATPASTAILMVHSSGRWQPMAYTGVVHPNLPILDDTVTMNPATPILDRFLRNELRNELQTEGGLQRSESYLPTLQALPGKTEFTNSLLPPNAQAALLLPVALVPAANEEPYRQAVLLLGSNQARSFTPRDIAWCQTVIARLETTSNDGDLNR
jgi:Cofactor assembly of complex C subunit B, CCB2/CCB4